MRIATGYSTGHSSAFQLKMSTYKRKRILYEPYDKEGRPGARIGTPKHRRMFREGHDRVGGYYGRYPQGSSHYGVAELKFNDSTRVLSAVGNTGFIEDSINLIPQNVGESGRIGRKCTVKYIFLRYQVKLLETIDVADARTGDAVRFILYQDKQCNGATAAVTDILETADIQSFFNLANSNRFIIHMDKTHSINYGGMSSATAGTVSQSAVIHTYEWNKKCNVDLEFSSTLGLIGEIRSNNFGWLAIAEFGDASLNSNFRVRFADP